MPLATNWSQTGTAYVSDKDGNDANAGTQPLPVQTIAAGRSIAAASNNSVICRSGFYNEGLIPTAPGLNANTFFRSEGLSVLDVSTFVSLLVASGTDRRRGTFFRGFIIQNAPATGSPVYLQDDCIYRDGVEAFIYADTITRPTQKFIVDSVNDVRVEGRAVDSLFFRCGFKDILDMEIGNNSMSTRGFEFCWFDTVGINPIQVSVRTVRFNNCAFKTTRIGGGLLSSKTLDGDAGTIGAEYAENEEFSGQFTENDYTYIFEDCFYTSDLGTNDSDNGLYGLTSSSPCLKANGIIGPRDLTSLVLSTDPAFDPVNGAVLTDVTRDLVNGWFDLDILPVVEGRVQSTTNPLFALSVSEPVTVSSRVFWGIAGFLFGSGEWVDRLNYNPGVNDEVRLTFLLSIYDETEPNGPDNAANFGPFVEYELNQPLTQDNLTRGNGNIDIDFSMSGAVTIQGRYAVDFVIRRNGV